MEIERKYLVASLPTLTHYKHHTMTQAYVSISPVIRLRQIDDTYFLTVKSTGHIIREELELPINKAEYDHLWHKVEGTPIEKIRYYIPLSSDLTAELDLYHGQLSGLYTVEVEFPSLDAANAFIPPHWFGADISTDPRYKNNHLSLHGLPS